jgi:fatty aldehyde-generating acyl-ACP reductase
MNRFAFMIHPLELNDFTRKFSWAERIPDYLIERVARFMPAFSVSHITGVRSIIGQEIEGFFVACPLTSKQMMELPEKLVLKKIIRAGKKAEELGAQILGLGAFTSVVGDKGITVARELDIPVTTGNSYTVATAIQGVKLAAEKMGTDINNTNLAIIGATGSIGKATSIILSESVNNLMLVARNEEKLALLREEILAKYPGKNISYTTNIKKGIRESRVIISASSSVEPLIDSLDLQVGAIVCDIARPRDVAAKVGKERDDVLVIEGGIVEIPGPVNFNFNFGYPPKTSYACMAETMILAFEGKFEDYSLGTEIELEKVRETTNLARKHGFKLAGLRSFERALSDEKINMIRDKAEEKLYLMSSGIN